MAPARAGQPQYPGTDRWLPAHENRRKGVKAMREEGVELERRAGVPCGALW